MVLTHSPAGGKYRLILIQGVEDAYVTNHRAGVDFGYFQFHFNGVGARVG